MTSPPTGTHTCYNCFAEFEWSPLTQDGEEFCCAGCADGGPCICTYGEAAQVTQSAIGVNAELPSPEISNDDQATRADEPVSSPPAASSAGDGLPPEPPDQPPAPGQSPDEEPPTNGRLAVIMAAVSEMPLPVQEVVSARLSTDGTLDEIGAPFGLTGEEVRQLLAQGQAILDRSLGPGFTIRYIAAGQIAEVEEPEPVFPSFEQAIERADERAGSDAEPQRAAAPEDRPSELGELIARSVDSLTRATEGEGPENEAAKDLISEALREAGNLFRLASERLGSAAPPEQPLRAALADARDEDEPVTLIVENPGEMSQLFIALQAAESVQQARLEDLNRARATFRLVASSMMGLVRDLMALEGGLRPSRLQMSGDEITVELPPQESIASPVGQPARAGGRRFELSMDSFFGARHFVASDGSVGTPHHHSYRVEASFISAEPDRQGFVMGFASVRQIVESTVMDYSETLLNTEDPFREMPPTTENLARVFHMKITEKLRVLDHPGVTLKHVRVWESPTNSATYSDSGDDAAITA